MFDKNTKILVVDDMFTMRSILEKSLKEFGFYDVLKAEDGLLAWEVLYSATQTIELVISDLNMPNLNGLELLKKVRSDERYSKVPFILVTADSEMDQVRDAINAGVTEYIVKPFNKVTFESKILSAYNKSKK